MSTPALILLGSALAAASFINQNGSAKPKAKLHTEVAKMVDASRGELQREHAKRKQRNERTRNELHQVIEDNTHKYKEMERKVNELQEQREAAPKEYNADAFREHAEPHHVVNYGHTEPVSRNLRQAGGVFHHTAAVSYKDGLKGREWVDRQHRAQVPLEEPIYMCDHGFPQFCGHKRQKVFV